MLHIIPTTLSKESVEQFRVLYRTHFNEEISYEKAEAEGLRLLRLMVAIIENLPHDDTMDVGEKP